MYEYNKSLDFLTGNGETRNERKAFELNKIAASKGDSDAILAMGWFYLNGVGVNEDIEKAIYWYKRSARKGERMAFFSLGYIEYYLKNYTSALNWFNLAIEKNHYRSLYWKAKIYYKGLDVEGDKKYAMKLINKAAANKDETSQRVLKWFNRK